METSATCVVEESPTGVKRPAVDQSSTDAEELLAKIQRIVDERDTYRAKCQRQEDVIAKLIELIDDYQRAANEGTIGPLKERGA